MEKALPRSPPGGEMVEFSLQQGYTGHKVRQVKALQFIKMSLYPLKAETGCTLITIFQNPTDIHLPYLSKASRSSRPMAPPQEAPNYQGYNIITARLTRHWEVTKARFQTMMMRKGDNSTGLPRDPRMAARCPQAHGHSRSSCSIINTHGRAARFII